MIGRLEGKIVFLDHDTAIIDVHGVGYEVKLSKHCLMQLHYDESVVLWICTQMKENEVTLFGFLTRDEQQCFEVLMTVQGIGGKVALAILSALTLPHLQRAISHRDASAFKKISGIGPKLASRIVNELQDKQFCTAKYAPESSTIIASDVVTDAVSALTNLGFATSEAVKVASAIFQNTKNITLEELITRCLSDLHKHKSA